MPRRNLPVRSPGAICEEGARKIQSRRFLLQQIVKLAGAADARFVRFVLLWECRRIEKLDTLRRFQAGRAADAEESLDARFLRGRDNRLVALHEFVINVRSGDAACRD